MVTVEENPNETANCLAPTIEYEKVNGQLLVCLTNDNETAMDILFDDEDEDYSDLTIEAGETEKVPFKHPLCWVYQCQ